MNKQQMELSVSDLTRLMLIKGYYGLFQVAESELSTRKGKPNFFDRCLEPFLKAATGKRNKDKMIYIAVDVYAPSLRDTIECRFALRQSPLDMFSVVGLRLMLMERREMIFFRFDSSHQFPGYQAVEGYFNKPKPWEDHLKGRFR